MEDERIIDAEETEEDIALEMDIRHSLLKEYFGHKDVK